VNEFPIMSDREFTQRILRIVRIGARQIIPAHVANTANFSVQEQIGSDMLLGLTAEVLRDHIVNEIQTVTLEVPATWWQHFKADHRDRFGFRRFIKRFPIRRETWTKNITFDRYYDYPDASIALPEDQFGKFIVYETVNQTDWNKR
jgi:hypothetical protein